MIKNKDKRRCGNAYECWKREWHRMHWKSFSGKPTSPHIEQTVLVFSMANFLAWAWGRFRNGETWGNGGKGEEEK